MQTKKQIVLSHKITMAFLVLGVFFSTFRLGYSSNASASKLPAPDSYYYYADGNRIELTPSLQWVAVKFATDKVDEQALTLQDFGTLVGPPDQVRQIPHPKLILLPLRDGLTTQSLGLSIGSIRADTAHFLWVNPVFQNQNEEMVVTDEFFAIFPSEKTREEIDAINSAHNVELVEPILGQENTFILRVLSAAKTDALSMANLYQESGVATDAAPDFVRIRKPNPVENPTRQAVETTPQIYEPNDPYYYTQWHLNNTGFNGNPADVDIDAPEAWGILPPPGSPTPIIAIIDTGVDLNHEDLRDNLVPGYDATGLGSGGGYSGSYWINAHGTLVAGVAAAITNNTLGVAGVCPQCRVMPVRTEYFNASGSEIIRDSWHANGITWAYQNGASILNNSWSGLPPSTLINAAIVNAKNQGRGGKGSVVVFSAGNANQSSVNYPADRSDVIAVGASNLCDRRKTPTNDSCNANDPLWGSNYGSALDISAPGEWLNTTDISGAIGASETDYWYDMDGTSGAAPIVSGVAGLILSVNPNLKADQVQYILQNTADDVNGGGKDIQMGYGRVNAYRAVQAARLTGPLYASAGSDLWRINPYTGFGTLIGSTGYNLPDIAFDGNTLYGVDYSKLLSIDPATGATSFIGDIGYAVLALTVARNGTMYGATYDGEFLRINKTTGAGTLIGNFGTGFNSSGDLAIGYNNTMYASGPNGGSWNDWLFKINLSNGNATPIGDIGEHGVFGLDFKDGILYGATTDGYLLEIDTVTGTSTRVSTFSADFWGLSSAILPTTPRPSAEFDAWPRSGDTPLPVSLHIVDTSNITSCFWDYGDNQTGTACTPFHNHTYSNAGSYTVTLTVNGPGGSDSMTRNSYIIVNNPGSTSWQGEYYNNETLSGNPVLVRDDPKINFDWFEGSPDPLVNPDHFSARWTKNVYFGGAGRYRFDVFRDDGVRLWVDDILILDAWSEGREWVSAEYSLPAGNHTVRLEIFEFEGWAAAILNISTPYIASGGANDGWVLESTETSNQGGIINAAATTFVLGDNAQDRQYRAILHFNTSALPDNAIIDSVRLRIKPNSMVGTDPFSTHQKLVFDIRKPYFGSAAALAIEDFQAGASRNSIGSFGTTPLNGWYYANLNATAFPYINLRGITQFRLRFQRDDNDDLSADYIGFYSGNAGSNRPLLIIQYHMDGQLFAQELVTPVP